jgi:hypothetical protein
MQEYSEKQMKRGPEIRSLMNIELEFFVEIRDFPSDFFWNFTVPSLTQPYNAKVYTIISL